jgi:outer membrane protein assembly factor BamB
MRKLAMVLFTGSALLGASLVSAQGMGMGGGGMTGGSGMLQVAGDGSLLVTRMEVGMMGGGQQGMERSVTNISASGLERWSTEFASGWPMMLATNGDLVVVVLADDWWMGGGGDGGGSGSDQLTLVGLDLATGAERWRTDLAGDMASPPQFAPDGSKLYVSTREMGGMDGPGSAPMHQGDAYGAGAMMSTTVVAVSRVGQVEWTLDLSGGHMGGPPTAGRQP